MTAAGLVPTAYQAWECRAMVPAGCQDGGVQHTHTTGIYSLKHITRSLTFSKTLLSVTLSLSISFYLSLSLPSPLFSPPSTWVSWFDLGSVIHIRSLLSLVTPSRSQHINCSKGTFRAERQLSSPDKPTQYTLLEDKRREGLLKTGPQGRKNFSVVLTI